MEIGIGVGFRFGVGIADGNITGIGIGFGIIAKLTGFGFGIKKSTGIGFGIVEGGFTPGLMWAPTTKRITTGKCTGTDVVQHLHQRPARTRRHSQLHLRLYADDLCDRVARKRLQRHRSVTHICPEHYEHLLRHEPTACEPFKDTCVCFPPKESRSQTRTECSVERY